jgi:hypothetical protein
VTATAAGAARRTARAAAAPSSGATFTSRIFASGARIMHKTAKGRVAITQPDDITTLGKHIYVAFQNGVGPQGQPNPAGNDASTVVEFDHAGQVVGKWDVTGKCDGLTADPAMQGVIATINEDAHSSLYVIGHPNTPPVHYAYSRPLPSKGGTDAISIYHGMVLISASAPGTTGAAAPRASYPAVYRATFHTAAHTVTMHELFGDESSATVANTGATQGSTTKLALTDPDSNEVVPAFAPRFAGDFMLTSQGDEEQIFRSPSGALSVLKLTASVDDTAWPSAKSGTLYAVDNGGDTIDAVTGPFVRGSVIAAVTPCDENGAPTTCPGPGFPANYLGQIDPQTGQITALSVAGHAPQPQGLLFLGRG